MDIVTTRMKELVHESDHPEMERAYSQLSGKKWERGHKLIIEHMEKAIKEIINKNSAENAMKKFSEFRFLETRGISSQVVDMANMVDEFFQEEMHIITYEKKANSEEKKTTNPTYTRQLKDAFCIFKICDRTPENSNKGYKGKIRELLQPAIEDLALFDIDTFAKGLKKFEEDWGMFADKPKPSAPADKAQANLAIKGGKPNKKPLPPLNPKVMDKLKQEAGSVRFTTVTFKKHADRVDAASFKKNSGRLCYWCIEEECLRERMRAWYKE